MQRESDKHSPRVDEEMKHELQSLVQGNAAEESRAREDFTQEAPTEDEMRFEPANRTLDEDRGIGIPDADADARSELARHVASAQWPASRDELVHAARVDSAPQKLLDTLRNLPGEVRFENVQEVWASLGGATEDSHTHG
jgi:hypothetical protein